MLTSIGTYLLLMITPTCLSCITATDISAAEASAGVKVKPFPKNLLPCNVSLT